MAGPDPADGSPAGSARDGEPSVAVFGVDHHRTPVAIRERLAVDAQRLPGLVAALRALPGTGEVAVLSTCNRLECYVGADVGGSAPGPDPQAVAAALAGCQGIDPQVLSAHAYLHRGRACVRHLFRVVSGIESLVIGEEQIVHQVKEAYERAAGEGSAGPLLHPLFQRALAVGREVRGATAIGRHKLSVASVAVDLARQVHGDLAHARLLVVGAGEIAELAITYLLSAGVRRLALVNRSRDRAERLAATIPAGEAEVTVIDWTGLAAALADHDIVVTSTAAPRPVLLAADVRAAMRRGRRSGLVVIDLAVPRDAEPEIADLGDVYLYNIDHLEAVVAGNARLRVDEVADAAGLVDAQVAAYVAERRPGQSELLAQVAGYFRDLVGAEDQRLAGRLGTALADPARGEARYALERVANKLQHQVMRYLKAHPGDAQAERVVRDLLGL